MTWKMEEVCQIVWKNVAFMTKWIIKTELAKLWKRRDTARLILPKSGVHMMLSTQDLYYLHGVFLEDTLYHIQWVSQCTSLSIQTRFKTSEFSKELSSLDFSDKKRWVTVKSVCDCVLRPSELMIVSPTHRYWLLFHQSMTVYVLPRYTSDKHHSSYQPRFSVTQYFLVASLSQTFACFRDFLIFEWVTQISGWCSLQ